MSNLPHRTTADEYFDSIRAAARGHQYYFPLNKELRLERCRSLARDIGYGLRDYPMKERVDFLQKTYGAIFVANCLDSIGVPFNAKEMMNLARSQWRD